MKGTVDVDEARTQLSRLLERVQAGEEITIAKGGRPNYMHPEDPMRDLLK
jgi:antitoxin (DNA-binding transcriptional repressor) of toxin-antitoxin stability system